MNAYVRTTGNGYEIMYIEGARILAGGWRNFSKEQRQTDNGNNRHFNIEVDESCVDILKNFGFDVKYYQPKSEDRPGFYHLDVVVSWKFSDPNVNVIAYNGVKTQQTEEMIGDLDHNNNIEYADMELTRSHWSYLGREGIKAYASNLYIYLGQPSMSEQRYSQRFGVPSNAQPEVVYDRIVNDEDDIPF